MNDPPVVPDVHAPVDKAEQILNLTPGWWVGDSMTPGTIPGAENAGSSSRSYPAGTEHSVERCCGVFRPNGLGGDDAKCPTFAGLGVTAGRVWLMR